MFSFFLKHKKTRGVITIFLTLIYLSVYLLIGIFVDGGRVRIAQTAIEDIQQIATENVMSQYNRGLYEYYGLFGTDGYTAEQISKDVQSQIEESIGLKFSENTIKSVLSSSYDVSSMNNNEEYYGKAFNPYLVDVKNVETKYIDLTEVDAVRAQIRDEMRYKAALVLGADFFDKVKELLSKIGGVNSVIDITKETSKEAGGLKGAKDAYFDSLQPFCKEFHDLVEKSYNYSNAQWGKGVKKFFNENTKKILEGMINFSKNPLKATIDTAKNFFSNVLSLFSGNKKDTNTSLENEEPLEEDDDIDMGLYRDDGGYKQITADKNSLFKNVVEAFDNGAWSPGEDHVETWTDEHGNEHERYLGDEHRDTVDGNADTNENSALDELNKIIDIINRCLDKLNVCIQNNEIYKNLISSFENYLNDKLNSESVKNDDTSKTIYAQYMETYLRQWNQMSEQRKVLLRVNDDLNKLKNILEDSKNKIDEVKNDVKNEGLSRGWTEPQNKLEDKADSFREPYHKIIISLYTDTEGDDGIKSFQDTSDGNNRKDNVFSLINKAMEKKKEDENKDEGIFKFNTNVFGEINKHEASENIIFNSEDYLSSEEDNNDFDDKKIESQILKIFEKAKQILNDVPKEMFNNMYDVTYILSHCRDYVHTYRYKENGYDKSEYKKSDDVDTVLNPKFVDDTHVDYLSATELENMQVTPAEIEYILFGFSDSRINVVTMYSNIFILRLALNYISALTSPNSLHQIELISAATGPFYAITFAAAPLIYALPQTILEVKAIMVNGEKAELFNMSVNLWDPYVDITIDKIKSMAQGIEEEARETVKTMESIAIEELLNSVEENNKEPERDSNIVRVVSSLREMVSSGLIVSYTIDNTPSFVNSIDEKKKLSERAQNATSELISGEMSSALGQSVSPSSTNIKLPVKAGYSTYLAIYLYMQGLNKKGQISRLQDVIETNMRHAQNDDFRLKNCYSQISVNTKSSMKYIFMTQSFMKRTFDNTKYHTNFNINVSTAYAY